MLFDFENHHIRSVEDLERLMYTLWAFPEATMYLFLEKEEHVNSFVDTAYREGRLLFTTTDMFWYRHPKYPLNFVRIGCQPQWDWQAEVSQNQPMYRRITLALSERERRRRDLFELHAGLKTLAN